jgi:hypothetical protein
LILLKYNLISETKQQSIQQNTKKKKITIARRIATGMYSVADNCKYLQNTNKINFILMQREIKKKTNLTYVTTENQREKKKRRKDHHN